MSGMTEESRETVNEEEFATTDLAERLAGSQGGDFAGELQARLADLQARVDAEMKAGVGIGQLEAYRQVSAALASATSVVIRAANAKTRQGVSGTVS